MEKTMFQGIECYIGYKALKKDLTNFMEDYDYKYEVNKWYKSIDVDTGKNAGYSYGLKLGKIKILCLNFTPDWDIYKCYIPIDQTIVFLENRDILVCRMFYLSDEIVKASGLEESVELTKEKQINLLCKHNKNFDYWNYDLTEKQVDLLCVNNENFKYWDYRLTKKQVSLLCEYRKDFRYWEFELNEHQVDLLCEFNENFKYWDYELTENQVDLLCEFSQNFKYWEYDLTEWQKQQLKIHRIIKLDKFEK